MDLKEFLQVLYKGVGPGALSVTILSNGKLQTKWFTSEQLVEMAEYIQKAGRKFNTHIGINPRAKVLGTWSRGDADDVTCVVAKYQDFDVSSRAHKETRLPANTEELLAFLKELPEQPTILVDSGNGVHGYWVLEEPFLIRTDDDRAYVQKIMRDHEAYVNQLAFGKYGWKFNSVADLARMLRAPETTNFKTDEHQTCSVIWSSDVRYKIEDFETAEKTISVSCPEENDFSLVGTGSSEDLLNQCEFMAHCRDHAAELTEPVWFAAITNLAQTLNGQKSCHEISRPYPRYTYEETEQKYERAVKQDKPITCEYIHDKLGFHCSKDCGVKTPVSLVHPQKVLPGPWEEPLPFDDFQLPVFPVDALPKPIADYVTALAESTQTPVDMAATCALAVLAVCQQGKFRIQAKADWSEPLNLFVLNVMEPSERKSAVENAMVRPINLYETEQNRENAGAIEGSRMRKRILEKRQRAIEDQVSKGKADMEDVKKIAQEIADFKEMTPIKLYVDDITTEKLTSVLANNSGRAAILSTEGGIFDTLSGIYTKNVNIDVMLKGYSGDSIRVDRIGRDSESILNPALTVLLMAQPSVLSGVMQNNTFRGRGLTSRFLYCIPTSFVGKRKYRSTCVPDELTDAYEQRIRNMLEEEYKPTEELITLAPAADELIEAFAEELEPKLIAEYADIADWAGKLIGNTLRIAGLLCRASIWRCDSFLDGIEGMEPLVVSEDIMTNAIRIAMYFTEHAIAAFSLMGADDTIK